MELPSRNRVAVYYSNHDIRVSTAALPAIGPDEALLRVHASGICGSDVMEWYRQPRAPTVLGHEVAGSVISIDGVADIRVGDRVVATHHVPCLECRYCKAGKETVCEMLRRTGFDPGGFAEYIRLPALNVQRGILKLPEHVSDDAASVVEPLACVVRAQRKARINPGEDVLIVGAGMCGDLHLLAAKAGGAGCVFMTDIRPERRAIATKLGADAVFDAADSVPQQVRQALGRGVDHVIVCTGAPDAIAVALAAVDRGGTVLFFAPMEPCETYALPFNEVFWRNDVTLTSSYGAGLADMTQALDLISSGRTDVSPLITHRIPLSEIGAGFEMMLCGKDSLKIIIDPRLDGQGASG